MVQLGSGEGGDGVRLQGVALGEEYHHLGGIFAVIETDHFTVEFQRPRGMKY
jgi:hypothetical protein